MKIQTDRILYLITKPIHGIKYYRVKTKYYNIYWSDSQRSSIISTIKESVLMFHLQRNIKR